MYIQLLQTGLSIKLGKKSIFSEAIRTSSGFEPLIRSPSNHSKYAAKPAFKETVYLFNRLIVFSVICILFVENSLMAIYIIVN